MTGSAGVNRCTYNVTNPEGLLVTVGPVGAAGLEMNLLGGAAARLLWVLTLAAGTLAAGLTELGRGPTPGWATGRLCSCCARGWLTGTSEETWWRDQKNNSSGLY